MCIALSVILCVTIYLNHLPFCLQLPIYLHILSTVYPLHPFCSVCHFPFILSPILSATFYCISTPSYILSATIYLPLSHYSATIYLMYNFSNYVYPYLSIPPLSLPTTFLILAAPLPLFCHYLSTLSPCYVCPALSI